MPIRLKPREHAFYELLSQAGQNVGTAADILVGLRNPGADRAAIAAAMRTCEHDGDGITHSILRLLNKSFITPFDREDIYRLAATIDDVVDAMEEATDFLDLADVGPLPDLMNLQIGVIHQGCVETARAMGRLQTLADLEPYWIEVNRLENEADQLYRRLLMRLFSGEYETLQLLKLREVADLFESAADALEHVANAVETIAVKES
jgi:predicted phosphate transport protein (TIGR00153 family)